MATWAAVGLTGIGLAHSGRLVALAAPGRPLGAHWWRGGKVGEAGAEDGVRAANAVGALAELDGEVCGGPAAGQGRAERRLEAFGGSVAEAPLGAELLEDVVGFVRLGLRIAASS